MTDGNLRQLFQKHLPSFHWQAIETGSTGRGIPDLNYCANGVEGWIELKTTETFNAGLRAEQIGWLERRTRAGGRTFIAIRRLHEGGKRKGPPVDELWLFPGSIALNLGKWGMIMSRHNALLIEKEGPRNWPWPTIQGHLIAP